MKCICMYVTGKKGNYVPAKTIHEALTGSGTETVLEEFFEYLDIRWIGNIYKYFLNGSIGFSRKSKGKKKMDLLVSFAKKHCKRILIANLSDFKPDFIIATHYLASIVIAELLSEFDYNIPVYYYASNIFSIPAEAFSDKVSRFYLPSKEYDLFSMNDSRVKHVPYPLQKCISNAPFISKHDARIYLGLNPEIDTIQLVLGRAQKHAIKFLNSLCSVPKKYQILVFVSDSDLKKKISRLITRKQFKNQSIKIVDFVDDINIYYSASDLICGKIGNNVIVESLFYNKPFIILERTEGDNDGYSFIIKNKLGIDCSNHLKKSIQILSDISGFIHEFEHKPSVNMEFGPKEFASIILKDAESDIN